MNHLTFRLMRAIVRAENEGRRLRRILLSVDLAERIAYEAGLDGANEVHRFLGVPCVTTTMLPKETYVEDYTP